MESNRKLFTPQQIALYEALQQGYDRTNGDVTGTESLRNHNLLLFYQWMVQQ